MKEAEIVAQINTDLKGGQFDSKKFQKGRFSGIAELVGRKEETVTRKGRKRE